MPSFEVAVSFVIKTPPKFSVSVEKNTVATLRIPVSYASFDVSDDARRVDVSLYVDSMAFLMPRDGTFLPILPSERHDDRGYKVAVLRFEALAEFRWNTTVAYAMMAERDSFDAHEFVRFPLWRVQSEGLRTVMRSQNVPFASSVATTAEATGATVRA